MYLAIEGCRSGLDLADHILNSLKSQNSFKLARIPIITFTYSDLPINFKLLNRDESKQKSYDSDLALIVEEEAKSMLPDTHVVLVQRLVDPFAERPAHYAALELMRGRLSGEIEDAEEARNRFGERLHGFFVKGATYGNSHPQRGKIKEGLFNLVWTAYDEWRTANPDMDLNEFDNTRAAHHSVEVYIQRLVKGRTFNDQLQELIVSARTLKQYGAKEITALLPYLEGRSDRDTTYGEGNLSRIWAEEMARNGINRVITWRKHSKRQANFYKENGIDFVEVYYAQQLRREYINRIANKLANQFAGAQEIMEKTVVAGPDEGSEEETIAFADDLTAALKCHPSLQGNIPESYEVPWIVYKKNREGKSQYIKSITPWKSNGIEKKTKLGSYIVVIRDDIFDTGGTITELLKTIGMTGQNYQRVGTGNCFIVVDAPVFSGGGIDHVFELQKNNILYELYAARIVEPPTRPEEIGQTIGYTEIRGPFTEQVARLHKQILGNK